jgi:hypothetical protein
VSTEERADVYWLQVQMEEEEQRALSQAAVVERHHLSDLDTDKRGLRHASATELVETELAFTNGKASGCWLARVVGALWWWAGGG